MSAKVSEQERIEQINALPNIRFIRWDGEFKGCMTKALFPLRVGPDLYLT